MFCREMGKNTIFYFQCVLCFLRAVFDDLEGHHYVFTVYNPSCIWNNVSIHWIQYFLRFGCHADLFHDRIALNMPHVDLEHTLECSIFSELGHGKNIFIIKIIECFEIKKNILEVFYLFKNYSLHENVQKSFNKVITVLICTSSTNLGFIWFLIKPVENFQ